MLELGVDDGVGGKEQWILMGIMMVLLVNVKELGNYPMGLTFPVILRHRSIYRSESSIESVSFCFVFNHAKFLLFYLLQRTICNCL